MPTEKLCVRALLWQIDVPKHGSNDIKRLALNDKAGGVTMPISSNGGMPNQEVTWQIIIYKMTNGR